MTQDEYMEKLQGKYEKYFSIEKDIMLYGETIDIHAKYCSIIGRTFITKEDVIDRCESYEYCYVKKFDRVTEAEADSFGQFLKKIAIECIKPGKDHMSTYITGVMVTGSINGNAKKAIRKYRCSKTYCFYLKGWCDVRLICVSLDSNEIITNKAGKRVQKVYEITP